MAETEDRRFERLSRDRFQRPPPKRFYKTVAVTDQLGIALDGKGVKTPLKAPLVLPNRALANAVAAEWASQEELINPHAMPLTKLANTAIDRAEAERANILAELLAFAGSDMVCYRADGPETLVARQSAHWDPVISWAKSDMDAGFTTANTITHKQQPGEALLVLECRVSNLDKFTLVAVHNLATLSGSTLLALMLAAGAISATAAWLAANADEDWQMETWGKDAEAMVRREARFSEFSACENFLNLVRDPS